MKFLQIILIWLLLKVFIGKMFFLFRAQDKNRQYEATEKSFADMVNYTYQYDENTILTKKK